MLYLMICAIGLVGEVELIGRLTMADVLLTAALPFIASIRGRVGFGPIARQFYVFVGLWFIGALFTDVIRGTSLDDISRGWSKIFFFTTNFTSIYLIANGERKKIIAFIFMLSIAGAVRLRIGMVGPELGSDIFGNDWKFGYGQLLAETTFLLAALLISNVVTPWVGILLPFVDASFNFLLNARNLFGITVLSGLALALTVARRRAFSPATLAAMGIAGLVTGWAVVSVYSYAASAGLLGSDAKDKYEIQSSGNLGVVLGGRTESLASTKAIIDSPIIGHGSWARDISYVEYMVSRLEQAGYNVTGDPFADDLIPAHSHLFGAWVEAGIFGAIFWLWAGWLALRGLYAAMMRPTPMTGFIVLIGLSLLWDILFSPFGLERRVVTSAWLVLMICIVEKSSHDRKLVEQSI